MNRGYKLIALFGTLLLIGGIFLMIQAVAEHTATFHTFLGLLGAVFAGWVLRRLAASGFRQS